MDRIKRRVSPIKPPEPEPPGIGGAMLHDEYTFSERDWEERRRQEVEADIREYADLDEAMDDIDELGDIEESDDPMQSEAISIEAKRHRKIREEAAQYPTDTRSWLMVEQMSQTEATLRVAGCL